MLAPQALREHCLGELMQLDGCLDAGPLHIETVPR
jgi:hypothetical protein